MSDPYEQDMTEKQAASTPTESPAKVPYATPDLQRRTAWDLTPFFCILMLCIVLFPMLARSKPDHCPNDAARWNTIFYLLEYGTYEYLPDWPKLAWNGGKGKTADQLTPEQREKMFHIGEKYYNMPRDIAPFSTSDFVKLPGPNSYYSAKPPLLPTVLAGVAGVVERVTGRDFGRKAEGELDPKNLADDPRVIIRTTIILTQVIPFIICIWLIRSHVVRFSDDVFVRNFTIGVAALATYLTPYLLTLNNHVFGAMLSLFAIHAAIRIWYDDRREWYWFAIAGFFAAFAAGVELPAGAFAVLLFIALVIRAPRETLAYGLPAAIIPVVATFITNYLGSGRRYWLPMQVYYGVEGGPYDYAGSYWRNPSGMDALDEPKLTYFMHLLIGHHGFFLLTPILLLGVLGAFVHWSRKSPRSQPALAWFVVVLSVAVFIVMGFKTNNYGGGCQGPRQFFWLIPFWLLMLPAGLEVLAKARVGRVLCYFFLAVSLFSVYWALPQIGGPDSVPWTDSWAHELFRTEYVPGFMRIKY